MFKVGDKVIIKYNPHQNMMSAVRGTVKSTAFDFGCSAYYMVEYWAYGKTEIYPFFEGLLEDASNKIPMNLVLTNEQLERLINLISSDAEMTRMVLEVVR